MVRVEAVVPWAAATWAAGKMVVRRAVSEAVAVKVPAARAAAARAAVAKAVLAWPGQEAAVLALPRARGVGTPAVTAEVAVGAAGVA